jgi:hypothetical protein
LYTKLNEAFRNILKTINFDERKEDSNRGKITFNSFRRFVRTTVGDQESSDYGEWFIGPREYTLLLEKTILLLTLQC